MATDTELLAALEAAHAAGDEAGAMAIAQEMNAQPVTHEPIKHAVVSPDDKPGGKNWEAQFGPTAGMSNYEKFAAGMGQSVYDTGRGISQMFGGQTAQDTDEQRKLDAPLDRTGAGLLGNMAGGVLQSVVPGMGAEAAGAKIASRLATNPGALQAAQAIYRIAKPAATGAAFGATGTVGTGETRLGNTGTGAIAGEVGGVLGHGANWLLGAGEDALSKGARLGAEIAKKYSIPLSMPQLAGGFTGFLGSALDKLPFSGASERGDAQRAAFNDALGRTAGVANAEGVLDHDKVANAMYNVVGPAIGDMAQNHTALVTQKNVNDVTNLLNEVNRKATDQNAKIVNNWAEDLYGMGQAGPSKVIPINNPLPGGPIGQIPGDAWREQNSALGNHIRRLGPNDGDLKHYLSRLQENYFDSMHAGMTPEEADQFGALRQQYRNAKTIEPLAEKADMQSGINPLLVQSRAISAKNNRGDVGELGDFAKSWLAKKYADSGTAQRALLYGTITGGVGALGNELLGSENNKHEHTAEFLAPAAAAVLGGLAGRGLGSRAMSKLYQARALPDTVKLPLTNVDVPVGNAIQALTSTAPAAAAEAVKDGNTATQGSTLNDLVQQGLNKGVN